ncbi:hemerythrin family protein [Thalassospiraceae bacterium LMO-JJ14]|nr:hemerythrin family protein [Thalassospiraceae bacterium LMO-JJ14]
MNTPAPFRLPEAFKIGISSIDDDHLNLVESINRSLLTQDGNNIKDFKKVFESFISDLKQHFENEEELMREAGYPGLDDHANHHKACLNQLNMSLETCNRRGYADRKDITGLFHNLIGIIAKADLKFVEYLWNEDLVDSFKGR